MFGADTPLVIDALQMASLAAVATGGAVWLFLRRKSGSSGTTPAAKAGTLEDRVRVLERIATDRSHDLADEIESLRDASAPARKTEEAA
ncbi:hypothetical protein [Parerythrobacter aestuarii]|uniref:hypothetical protein n=1 Tax=Parerythrobacter aestuarii TaxID=3020909 RepID=UPI0024DEE591|nr:hypothetical protein [Parerythrobacter aestuarii]